MGRVLGAIFYGLAILTGVLGIWLMAAFDGGALRGAGTVAFVSIGIPSFGSALALLFFGYVCFALDEIVERLGRIAAKPAGQGAASAPVEALRGAPATRSATAPRAPSGAAVKGRVAG